MTNIIQTDIFWVPSAARIRSPPLPSPIDSLKASRVDFFDISLKLGEFKRLVVLTMSGDEANTPWLPVGMASTIIDFTVLTKIIEPLKKFCL